MCIFQKSYAYFGGILTKFKKRGTLVRSIFFGTFFWQKYGKNSAATQ